MRGPVVIDIDEYGLMIERLKRIQALVIRQSVLSLVLGGFGASLLGHSFGFSAAIVGTFAGAALYYALLHATRPLK